MHWISDLVYGFICFLLVGIAIKADAGDNRPPPAANCLTSQQFTDHAPDWPICPAM